MTGFYNKYDEAFAMALQPDNKIVVAGTTDTGINRDFALARYDNTALGTPQFENISKIIVYPNPVGDTLYVSGELFGKEYLIYNMEGKILLQGTASPVGIPVHELRNGLYLVRIGSNQGIKIIKH